MKMTILTYREKFTKLYCMAEDQPDSTTPEILAQWPSQLCIPQELTNKTKATSFHSEADVG